MSGAISRSPEAVNYLAQVVIQWAEDVQRGMQESMQVMHEGLNPVSGTAVRGPAADACLQAHENGAQHVIACAKKVEEAGHQIALNTQQQQQKYREEHAAQMAGISIG